MANGRCRVHGGKSTGPRTPEGLEWSRKAAWKHGHYSAEEKAARRKARQQSRLMRQMMDELMEDGSRLRPHHAEASHDERLIGQGALVTLRSPRTGVCRFGPPVAATPTEATSHSTSAISGHHAAGFLEPILLGLSL